MSTTSVNPGRWLMFAGSLEIKPSEHPNYRSWVMDRESEIEVNLVDLLEQFRADDSPIIGSVKITIELVAIVGRDAIGPKKPPHFSSRSWEISG
jgi:hypothetical protein